MTMKHVELRECVLAGTAHLTRSGDRALADLAFGEVLALRRKSKNRYDNYAIGVYAIHHGSRTLVQVGWIPKRANKILALMMDGGCALYATFVSSSHIDFHDPLNVWIEVYWEREETEAEKAAEVRAHVKRRKKKSFNVAV